MKPVHVGIGTAILAQRADEQVLALVERHNARARRRADRVDPVRMLRDVREVRRRGYAVAYDAVFPDTGAIGVPFPSDVDGFPMAIGVGGLRERMRRNEAAIFRAVRSSLARHVRSRAATPRAAARG